MKKFSQSEMDKATIMFLSTKLPNVGDEAAKFLTNPFDFSVAFKRSGKRAAKQNLYWCCDCGESFCYDELTDIRINPKYAGEKYCGHYRKNIATCPCCGKTIEIDDWDYKRKCFTDIVCIQTHIGEWSVARYFDSHSSCAPGRPCMNWAKEIGQCWEKDGRTYHYHCMKGGMFYQSYWKEDSPWRFYKESPECHEQVWDEEETYDIPADFSVDTEIAKRGISADELHGMRLTQILQYMNDSPHFETLWKEGEYEMAKFFRNDIAAYWPQIKIARRHGYKIDDLIEWRDLIDLCKRTNRDAHSPKFVCPANLHEMHQRLVMADRKKANDRLLAGAMIHNKEYTERIAQYLNMDIHDDFLTIVVLPNIPAFKEEADHLCHCVFSCAYYNRVDSLLLSARDATGKRWETIEVSLNDFRILQSYGYGDKHTERHKEIIDLVNANMWQISQRRLAS